MPIIEKLNDGDIVLETRGKSSNIQARWKSNVEGRRYERVSLETADLYEAKVKAKKEYDHYRAHVITGMPLEAERTVKFVALQYLESLGDAKQLPKQMKQYVSAIKNYVIPALGDRRITEINSSALDAFNAKRDEMMGTVPKKGTVSKHHTAIRYIFEYAIERKFCSNVHMPKLTVKGYGSKSEARPAFNDKEMEVIWDRFDEWIGLATKSNIIYRRKILKLVCYFMYKVGCRPGVEVEELQWSCIQHETNGEITLHIHKSKYEDKQREIKIPYILLKTLKDIGDLTGRTKLSDYIFCNPLGDKLVDLSRTFNSFLEYAEMKQALTGKYKGRERTLYSFRHTFATQKVRELSLGEITDMAEYMGTSPEMIVRFYVESDADRFARNNVIGTFSDGIAEFYRDGKGSDASGFEIANLYSEANINS